MFKITAYGADCDGCNGITFTGTVPQIDITIAVDPDVIPLGSTVLINGKEYIAEDTGGAIQGNVIDLYVGTEAESEIFGVRYEEVKVKEKRR